MQVIPRELWTPEILNAVLTILRRCQSTMTECKDDDIIVAQNEDDIFVLGNPVLRTHEMIDQETNEYIVELETRNITLEYCAGRGYKVNGGKASVPVPRVVILRPDLCIKLDASGPCGAEVEAAIEDDLALSARAAMLGIKFYGSSA